MVCSRCRSTMIVVSRPAGRARSYVYQCGANRHGRRRFGECPNNVVLPLRQTDQAILDAVEAVLDPSVVRDAVVAAVKTITSQKRPAVQRVALAAQLTQVEKEIGNLVRFVKRGEQSETIAAELQQAETRKRALTASLARLDQIAVLAGQDLSDLENKISEILSAWRWLADRHVGQTRQLLRKLLPERLAMTPTVRGPRRWYQFDGTVRLTPLLGGLVPALGDSPTQWDDGWWPQRAMTPVTYPPILLSTTVAAVAA